MKARGAVARTEAQRQARRDLESRCKESLANAVPADVIDGLRAARPTLALATGGEQQGLAYLAWCASMEYRKHRELPEYFSVHNRELEARFGRNGFKRLNARHDLFEVVPAARRGLTNAYRLKPDVHATVTTHIRARNECLAPVAMVLPNGN